MLSCYIAAAETDRCYYDAAKLSGLHALNMTIACIRFYIQCPYEKNTNRPIMIMKAESWTLAKVVKSQYVRLHDGYL